MDNHKRQQALDNLRNALGRLEQSDFEIRYKQSDHGLYICISDAFTNPDSFDYTHILYTISNHTLKLKEPE